MKNDAKRDWLHIGVYLAICFVITFAVEIPLLRGRTYQEFAGEPRFILIGNCFMLFPALSVLLTRLVTKQGWEESYLHLHLKGNFRYYLLSVLLPVCAAVVTSLLYAIRLGGLDVDRIREGATPAQAAGLLLLQISTSLFLILPGFGEELGWRGYLYPMLERRLGLIPAMLVGGVIWGLWHAPLTYAGHNFGQDYWGYPWMGYVMMSVFCICIGIPMHYITQKSGSVFPAALFHMVNNNVVGIIEFLLVPQAADHEESNPLAILLLCVPYGAAAGVCIAVMAKEKLKVVRSS